MIKFCIASHGNLANGMLDSLKMFLGEEIPFEAVAAYLNDEKPEESIQAFLDKANDNDTLVFLTDIAGGSINQIIVKMALNRPNTYIISGFNFPMILQLATLQPPITTEKINHVISQSRDQIMYINETLKNVNDDDE